MEQITDKFQSVIIEDIRKNPDVIMGILLNESDLSLLIEKRGNTVRYAYIRTYSNDSRRVLEEAKREYMLKKKKGYSREDAFKDLTEALEEISAQLTPQRDE
jgi:hypothetical protein